MKNIPTRYDTPHDPMAKHGAHPYASSHFKQVSVRAVKGYRVTMEDEYALADGNRLAAIFDGHGGGGVSRLLQQRFWPTVKECLAEVDNDDDDGASIFSYVAALKRAVRRIDALILQDPMLQYQGSTLTAVWVHSTPHDNDNDTSKRQHRTLLAANLGDSRAVLSRSGHAVALTRDHKPNDPDERNRLVALGETIAWDKWAKVHRVRNLSLSRAVGDGYAKPAVSSDVEIRHFPIAEETDEFVLLASDGLWDVMSSQEAVSLVHRKLQTELARVDKHDQANYRKVLRRHMSKFLTREALNRGSGDNICVVLIWLKD